MKDEVIYLSMLGALTLHELGELIGKELQRRSMFGTFVGWNTEHAAVSAVCLPEGLRDQLGGMTLAEELALIAALMENYEEQRKIVFPPPEDDGEPA